LFSALGGQIFQSDNLLIFRQSEGDRFCQTIKNLDVNFLNKAV